MNTALTHRIAYLIKSIDALEEKGKPTRQLEHQLAQLQKDLRRSQGREQKQANQTDRFDD